MEHLTHPPFFRHFSLKTFVECGCRSLETTFKGTPVAMAKLHEIWVPHEYHSLPTMSSYIHLHWSIFQQQKWIFFCFVLFQGQYALKEKKDSTSHSWFNWLICFGNDEQISSYSKKVRLQQGAESLLQSERNVFWWTN